MNRKVAKSLSSCAALLCAVSTLAQSFSIDWFTIDGGGNSAGGLYSVRSIIGQPDAGKMSGGNYTLSGGFWSVVQEDGMPPLSVELRTGNLVLSWPANLNGVVVQSATQLLPGGAGWADYGGVPVRSGNRFEVAVGPTLTPPDPIRFFRLHRP